MGPWSVQEHIMFLVSIIIDVGDHLHHWYYQLLNLPESCLLFTEQMLWLAKIAIGSDKTNHTNKICWFPHALYSLAHLSTLVMVSP